jgi:osmoprotectant transport system permease protein
VAAAACIRANDWFCPAYLSQDHVAVVAAVKSHLALTAYALGLALLVAVPLALLVRRSRAGRLVALGVGGIIYTVPSLALFVLLGPLFGFTSSLPVVVALAAYDVQVLVRQLLVGLDGVPSDVVEAAVGVGYSRSRLLARVELPLALPALVAGLRLAAVSTIALVTVGAVIGHGGIGTLLYAGFQTDFKAQQLTSLVLVLLLALVVDLLLQLVLRALTPWQRAGRATS